MDNGLIGTIERQATFVAGDDAWFRNKSDPGVLIAIENAILLIGIIGDGLEAPEISGGTTSDPDTILSLFWMVRKAKRIFGVTVDFNRNNTCRLSWSSPVIHQTYENLSVSDLISLDIPQIFKRATMDTHALDRRLKMKMNKI